MRVSTIGKKEKKITQDTVNGALVYSEGAGDIYILGRISRLDSYGDLSLVRARTSIVGISFAYSRATF